MILALMSHHLAGMSLLGKVIEIDFASTHTSEHLLYMAIAECLWVVWARSL
jgi:hypothetical protein